MKLCSFLIAVLIILLKIPQVWAAEILANSCSQSDIQTAIDSAIVGDTVNVPSGSCTWTTTVNVSKAIHLHGAGYTGSSITQITSGLATPLKFTLTSCSSSPEIDGFLFVSTNAGGNFNQGSIVFTGTCHQIKVHDNKMTQGTGGKNNFLYVTGDILGVVYNNTMINPTSGVIGGNFVNSLFGTYNGNGDQGDGSWMDGPNYTGADSGNYLYIEGNTYISASRSFFSDGWRGNRVVYRYNTIENGNPTSHGFDSGGRSRGQRIAIGYNNSITLTDGSGYGTCWQWRAGTGLLYNNNFGNGWGSSNCISAKTYRHIDAILGESETLGENYGLSSLNGMCWEYDSNNTNTLCNASVQNTPCTGGDCATTNNCTGAHYVCKNVVTLGKSCTGNANSGILDTSCDGDPGDGSYCLGPVDDPNGNGQGVPCRDGVGLGRDSGISTAQNSEPIFVFSNTGNAGLTISTDATQNVDYYTTASAGVTTGLDSAKPSSCTQGHGYWATDTRQLYRCDVGGSSWSLYYAEYICPHPLSELTGGCDASKYGASGYAVMYKNHGSPKSMMSRPPS